MGLQLELLLYIPELQQSGSELLSEQELELGKLPEQQEQSAVL